MQVYQLLSHIKQQLAYQGIADSALEAELLAAHALGVGRTQLYLDIHEETDGPRVRAVTHLVDRRLSREPLAYILGEKEFFGISLFIGPGVMVPRQETETLVEEALRLAHTYPSPVIVDVGTGSGAIALSLALNHQGARVYATDISLDALEVAQKNLKRCHADGRVQLLRGDLLDPLPEPVDFIVANLPYIPDEQLSSLQPEIRHYEPQVALNGGRDGQEVYERLLHKAPQRLKEGGALLLEISPEQRAPLMERARASFPKASMRVVWDIAGLDRVIVVQD